MRAVKYFGAGLFCCLCVLWAGCGNENTNDENSSQSEDTAGLNENSLSLSPPEQSSNQSISLNNSNRNVTNPVSRVVKNDFQPAAELNGKFVNSMREWKDSANNFSTRAELLAVAMKTREVKLLKENGVTITVDYEILSHHDQNYITEFVFAHRTVHQPKLVENFD